MPPAPIVDMYRYLAKLPVTATERDYPHRRPEPRQTGFDQIYGVGNPTAAAASSQVRLPMYASPSSPSSSSSRWGAPWDRDRATASSLPSASGRSEMSSDAQARSLAICRAASRLRTRSVRSGYHGVLGRSPPSRLPVT